jgi:hypothetical protein
MLGERLRYVLPRCPPLQDEIVEAARKPQRSVPGVLVDDLVD